MKEKKSFFIRPLIILIDLLLINGIIFIIGDYHFFNFSFLSYITVFWLLLAYFTNFYSIYRYTSLVKLITQSITQYFIFFLAYLSYFSLFKEGEVIANQKLTFVFIISSITFVKLLIFTILKIYRSEGKDFRNVVLFGDLKSAKILQNLFNERNDLGYKFYGFFSENEFKSKFYLGCTKKGFQFILDNNIDEIYYNPIEIPPKKIIKIRKFASQNDLDLRLIPENNAIYSKDFVLEFFGTVPILKPQTLPFEKIETHIIKRIFDICFSLMTCIFILSWMLPILWIIIRLDSKGPLFFKQKRDGRNGKQFYCYKLRSMRVNSQANILSASKNDEKITKVGAFLRRTSLDEMPQFWNVLKGDMSVVGPRPHMNLHTKKYEIEVDNYLIRNSVKPGITGLAQISGFRGEVIKKSDIKNRVRLDIFYIENWTFILDIKIIVKTLFNVFSPEEKAY